MVIKGIGDAARTLSFYMRMQEVAASNLANVSTDAFKADRLSAMLDPGSGHPVPVMHTDLRQGALRDTGRPFDLALEGDGFFVVGTPQGERLTRGGSFQLDAAGRLVDTHGNPLLGIDGPVVVPPGDPIVIQDDGRVLADDRLIGQLRLETVPDPSRLRKEGLGHFVTDAPREAPAAGALRVRQGRLEGPNFDPLTSMVDLVAIQRAYAANVQALRVMDSVLDTISNQVGRA